FATRRIMPKQKDVAIFARDLILLKADIICTHFSPKTISMITGYPQLQPVPPMPAPPRPPLQPPMGMGAPQPPQIPGQPPQPPQPSPAEAQYQQQLQAYQQQVAQVQAVIKQNQALQQQFDAAVTLLKRDAFHFFHIDIEADSTIAPDEEAE